VTGRWGDIEGVWIAPVIAQVMMTFRGFATSEAPLCPRFPCRQAEATVVHRWLAPTGD
jgi:hypothetical protein